MLFKADGWWERAKKESPRIRASDVIDDQTHWHHAFVTVLIGGGIAWALLSLLQFVAGLYGWELPWNADAKIALGCFIGNACYLIREIEARVDMGWGYKLWDGFLDVYVPACLWVPLWAGSFVVLYGMIAVYAGMFFLARPRP